MASVIKSGRVIPSGTPVQQTEFNLEDMSQNASNYLETVRQQAAKIVRDAQQQAQQITAQAVASGRQAALAEARKAALEDCESRWQTLAPALQQAIEAAGQLRAAWVKQWEKQMVRLVTSVAERVIRGELTRQPQITQTWAREALELASGSTSITLQLHPTDYDALGEQRESLQRDFSQLAEATIVADPDISPGGCRVVTEYGHIDQQIEAQLARIEEELTS